MPSSSAKSSVRPQIVLSVVSHGQGSYVKQLLADIEKYCDELSIHVLLTLNIAEPQFHNPGEYKFPISVIVNLAPKGFGANHNAAFRHVASDFCCVVNPDIRLVADPFPALLDCAMSSRNIGLVAPQILSPGGEHENSARRFPTPWRIVKKYFGNRRLIEYPHTSCTYYPDWIAGMFMLVPSHVYAEMKGFDESYFLYYEDVDLCGRLRLAGYEIACCPQVVVTHMAQRDSHRKIKYRMWHVGSMVRFFSSVVFVRLLWRSLWH